MIKFVKWLTKKEEITDKMRAVLMMMNYFLGFTSGLTLGSIIF